MSIIKRLKALFRSGAGEASEAGMSGGMAEAPMAGMADMISCEDALRLVHDYLDGELEDVPENQVRQHFDMCERCYPHLKLESVYRDAMHRVGSGGGAPAGLKDRVSALLAEADAEG